MCAKNTVLQDPGVFFFSLSELQKLVEQENSCVSVITTKRSLSLMPLHLKDLKASIKELLKAKVNRYDVQLEGVILAHKNVKLMLNSTHLSDSRYFHLEYTADIYVFKPKVGDMLTGIVNKVTKQYVNILVHGIFNVTVYSSGSQEIGNLKIGSQVVVKVTALDYTGRLPFIKASIIPSSVDEETEEARRKLKKKKKKSRGYEEKQTSLIGVSQREEHSSLIGVSQRKKIVSILKNSPLRIVPHSSSELESQDAESSSTESSKAQNAGGPPPAGQVAIEKPKKHKKNKKSKSEEIILGETPSKKRKREGEHADASLSPKKKKKKHRDKEVEGNDLPTKPPLDNTIQIQADESIVNAASSTPILGPPPPPKKGKRKNSDKADQSTLVESLMQMKMEEMSGTEPIDPTLKPQGASNKSKKNKIKLGGVESHSSSGDMPPDNTTQIQADKSIVNAASSTPMLGPPQPSRKRKLKNSDKADQSTLVESLMQMKMEEISGTETIDPTLNLHGDRDKSTTKKIKIKQEVVGSHSSRDDSSSIDGDSQTSGGKKKKKKKKNDDYSSKSSAAIADLTKSMLSTLKTSKGEVT